MKLPLLPEERSALRRLTIRAADLAAHDPQTLAQAGLPLERARYLVALANFQTLDSVGPAAAQDFWDLGCRSLADLAEREPVALYAQFVAKVGVPVDPCVEDVFRCAIAQVRNPQLAAERKNWWYWKPERGQPMNPAA